MLVSAFMEHAITDQIGPMQARQENANSVQSLLGSPCDPITAAVTLLGNLSSCAVQFSVNDLRSLSFVRDRVIPGQGSVSFATVRSLARRELKERRAWRVKDRLRALFSRAADPADRYW